jgi:hypothetical protein
MDSRLVYRCYPLFQSSEAGKKQTKEVAFVFKGRLNTEI